MEQKHIAKYNTFCQEMATRKKELENKLSVLDLQQEDLLHFLELEKLDAAKIAKVAKRIKLIRQERRIVKHELHEVTAVWERLNKPISVKTNMSGKYKTNILKEFM